MSARTLIDQMDEASSMVDEQCQHGGSINISRYSLVGRVIHQHISYFSVSPCCLPRKHMIDRNHQCRWCTKVFTESAAQLKRLYGCRTGWLSTRSALKTLKIPANMANKKSKNKYCLQKPASPRFFKTQWQIQIACASAFQMHLRGCATRLVMYQDSTSFSW